MTISNTHEFALYYELLPQESTGIFELRDKELVQRIRVILRLKNGESCILFNRDRHMVGVIASMTGSSVIFNVTAQKMNQILVPSVTWYLPFLKRAAFEESLYHLVELGATAVQPVRTTKSYPLFSSEKERLRYIKIMHAAAEQSKQFAFPLLLPPKSLEEVLAQKTEGLKLLLDAEGSPVTELIATLSQESKPCIILSGPEGDLTPSEKEAVRQAGFISYRLTPTILRAETAITVGLGLLRSIMQGRTEGIRS